MGIQERKEREKEHRREEILDAAQKVFFEKGLNLATMDEIAELAELSKGTLYLYYRSKEDLYLAVHLRGLEILYAMFKEVIESDRPITGRIADLADTYGKYFEKNRNYFRMMRFSEMPQFHWQVSDEMRRTTMAFNERLWGLVIGFLKRGMEEGKIRSDLTPAEIAVILWSSATALMLRLDSEHELWSAMGVDLAATLRKSNDLFLESILTEKGKAELRTLQPQM